MAFVVSIVPSAIDQLIALVNATKGQPDGLAQAVTVTDGPGVSGNAGDQLAVGMDDPDEPFVNAANAQQSWAHATGTARDEDASLWCTAIAFSGNAGDKGQKDTRDRVYAIAAVVAGVVLADYTLDGLDGLLWARFGGQQSLHYRQDTQGTTAYLIFQLNLKARI